MDVCQDVTQIRQSPKVNYFKKWKKPIKTNSYSSNFRWRSNKFWTWLFSLCDAMNALMWSTSCSHSLRLYCSWFISSWSARIRVVIGRNGAILRVLKCLFRAPDGRQGEESCPSRVLIMITVIAESLTFYHAASSKCKTIIVFAKIFCIMNTSKSTLLSASS